MVEIMQGSSIPLGIVLRDKDTGAPITDEDVTEAEVVLGHIRKTMSDGGVYYDSELEEWTMPLTQDETFSLIPKTYKPAVRVVLTGGAVPGTYLDSIRIVEGKSKEVL